MKKNIINSIFGLAVASLMLTACSSADDAVTQSPAAAIDDNAINFGAYLNRNTTRGGWAGELTTAKLQTDANGFGVLAYFTDNQPYTINATPNFMYNQQVTFVPGDPGDPSDQDHWTYSPLKYWPNEFGDGANSEGMDRLSFFAYAPYTEVSTVTGEATTNAEYGITGMTRSTENGYPKVRYAASFDPTKRVDLCWAAPLRNQVKQAVDGSVDFEFNHALASLNVQIDALFDETAPGTGALDANTRIWVRSVTFDGFAIKGELNLNNDNPYPEWNNLYSNLPLSGEPVTIYDGRRDGREGYAAMPNENPIGINSELVQDGEYVTNATTITAPYIDKGVTATTVNLFDGATEKTDPIYVIPTGVPLQITIVYDVETFDPNLQSSFLSDAKTKGVTIENAITKTVLIDPADDTSTMILDAGFKYKVNIHLGMTSVKATATVTPWDDGDEAEADLPGNTNTNP